MDFKVHYIHHAPGDSYWVSRGFPTQEAAQEYIDNNALVFPLPGPAYITDKDDNKVGDNG